MPSVHRVAGDRNGRYVGSYPQDVMNKGWVKTWDVLELVLA